MNASWFKKVQDLVVTQKHKTKKVPGRDVENRWNMMFTMIDSFYNLTEYFQSLSNISKHYINIETLTSIEYFNQYTTYWSVSKTFLLLLMNDYSI